MYNTFVMRVEIPCVLFSQFEVALQQYLVTRSTVSYRYPATVLTQSQCYQHQTVPPAPTC